MVHPSDGAASLRHGLFTHSLHSQLCASAQFSSREGSTAAHLVPHRSIGLAQSRASVCHSARGCSATCSIVIARRDKTFKEADRATHQTQAKAPAPAPRQKPAHSAPSPPSFLQQPILRPFQALLTFISHQSPTRPSRTPTNELEGLDQERHSGMEAAFLRLRWTPQLANSIP